MSSVLDLIKRRFNRGLTPFRFTLSESSEGVKELATSPDGWRDMETEYFRSPTYFSCNRKGANADLIFYKSGKQFLQNVYENSGPDASANMKVEKLDKQTQTYEDYPTANKPDLGVYEVDEVGVTVKMLDTDFKEKVYNRDKIPIDITQLTSIDGFTVADFPINEITMPENVLVRESNWDLTIDSISDEIHTPPIVLTAPDTFQESRTPDQSAAIPAEETAFFINSIKDRILTITGRIKGTYSTDGSGGGATYSIRTYESDGTPSTAYPLFDIYTAYHTLSFDETYSVVVTIPKDSYLVLNCVLTGDITHLVDYEDGFHKVVGDDEGNPEVIVSAFRWYELFLRLYQLTTDTDNPFKSDFFGCTDTPLTTYASDGEIGFVTKGVYFRKAQEISSNITIKPLDAFNAASSIFRLGLGIETIGGVEKVVIEHQDYFFDDNVVMDISDKLREENIGKKVVPELFFNSGEFGFAKFDYEKDGGLLEFNTKNVWSTVVKFVEKGIKKISTIRGDGQGMINLMNAPFEVDEEGESTYDQTKDFKGDSDIFCIDALRDGADFKARTNEGFTNVSGSLFADTSFNMRYSPARVIRRWGANIKAGLGHSLNSWLRWQSSDKNTTLASQYTGEPEIVVENADIRANDLNNCKWLPEAYIIKDVPITLEQLKSLDENSNGIIKLGDTKYGWIPPGSSIKIKNYDLTMSGELLRVNLNNCTPTELI